MIGELIPLSVPVHDSDCSSFVIVLRAWPGMCPTDPVVGGRVSCPVARTVWRTSDGRSVGLAGCSGDNPTEPLQPLAAEQAVGRQSCEKCVHDPADLGIRDWQEVEPNPSSAYCDSETPL